MSSCLAEDALCVCRVLSRLNSFYSSDYRANLNMSNIPSDFQDRYKFTHLTLKLLINAKRNCNILGSTKASPARKVKLMLFFPLSSSKDKQFAEFGFKIHGNISLERRFPTLSTNNRETYS